MKLTFAAFATLVSTAFAQQTFMINTPGGAITTCVNITLSWVKGNAAANTATFNAIDASTGNSIPILTNVDLSSLSTSWKVNIPPGTYNIEVRNGADNPILSGQFKVSAGADTSCVGKTTPGGPTEPTNSTTSATTPASAPTTTATSAGVSVPASSSSAASAASVPTTTATKASSANILARPAVAGVLALAAAAFMF